MPANDAITTMSCGAALPATVVITEGGGAPAVVAHVADGGAVSASVELEAGGSLPVDVGAAGASRLFGDGVRRQVPRARLQLQAPHILNLPPQAFNERKMAHHRHFFTSPDANQVILGVQFHQRQALQGQQGIDGRQADGCFTKIG